jgi:putative transposase
MLRTYKYRLYPNRTQDKQLDFMLWQMRNVYNDALAERRWRWERSRLSTSYNQQWQRLKQLRHELPDEIGQLSATAMQQMLRRLDKAYRAFYKGIRGIPRFKNRKRFKSMAYRHGDSCKLRGNRFYVYRVGEVRMNLHRPIPEGAKFGQVIIKRNLGKWTVYFQLHLPDIEPPLHTGTDVGIDVGISSLLSLSNGVQFDNPRWLRNNLKKLRVLNRRLARQKKGGSNWRKTANRIAKLHEKIANQRKDFWHKTTRQLANDYSVIHTENLHLAFMLRGKLALSAHDAALGMFFNLLPYKCAETGSKEIKKNPSGTSIECSACGERVPKSLATRVHACPHCGLIKDRDVNAAINIKNKAWTEPLEPKVDGRIVLVPRSSPF